jgi:hypothetical protein
MKKAITTIALAAVLTFTATFANAGIIVAGVKDDGTAKTDPCTQTEKKYDSGIIVAGLDGIIVAGFDGIIVAGFTGIIVAGFGDTKDDTTVNCGIIVAG